MEQLPDINKFVRDWADITVKRLASAIVKKGIGGSSLKNSLHYQVIGGGESVPSKVIISYLESGKYVDMGVGRGQKLGDVKGNKKTLAALGLHGRVAKKWYSKTITAETRRLSELLSEYYGKAMIAVVNDNIPSQIHITL